MLNYSWKASPNRWGSEFNATLSIGFWNGLHLERRPPDISLDISTYTQDNPGYPMLYDKLTCHLGVGTLHGYP